MAKAENKQQVSLSAAFSGHLVEKLSAEPERNHCFVARVEMKEELRSLDDNLKELKEELGREENLFEKVKKDHEKKELTNQIQISPK